MTLRLYVTGRMALTGPDRTVFEEELPGRQGRLLLAYLALHGKHPVAAEHLVEVVWAGRTSRSSQPLLKPLVSHTRSAIRATGAPAERVLVGLGGTYQLRLPPGSWVDLEAGVSSVDRAEAALRRGDLGAAWADAAVASTITGRPLLPQEDAPWLDDARGRLGSARLRALDVLVEVWLARRMPALALALATESVTLAPLRESSWRLQMRAHAAAGDHAQALDSYRRCERELRQELGIGPAAATRVLRDEIAARGSASTP